MKGGAALEIFLIVATIAIMVLAVLLIMDGKCNFMFGITLLISIGSMIWLSTQYYKPAFTEITFLDDGIVTKSGSEQQKLTINDIQGIWYFKISQGAEAEIMEYSEDASLKGSIVVIGDIEYFAEIDFVGLNGMSMLRDSFKQGYTTIYYRKELKEILSYYHRKIQNRPKA